eukprot:TRINITY_DN62649_c0_g1_i1.p1 TRINITY_DN62649_c0_g1~~TRINITY_DN62649_c0_g1_i1.p1  ORF type:complete len:253 (-),score=48.00 TRINITY_DN62649_c0_g1_i1:165-872(-)
MAATQDDDEPEVVLLHVRVCKVYPIPPGSGTASGHRAEDWKDSIWTGSCKVVGKGKDLAIKLVDSCSGDLFAQCLIPVGTEQSLCVQPVVDSSRYFVIKIVKAQRHAFIGFGFSDRNDAFDFKAALSDFKTSVVDRETQARNAFDLAAPMKDLSLQEGQTITVKLPGKDSAARTAQKSSSGGAVGGSALPLLPPPPPSNGLGLQRQVATTVQSQDDDFADFADFASAPPLPATGL